MKVVDRKMYDPENDCKKLVLKLKKLCEEKGKSSYMLAKEAGISPSTLSYLLNGKTKPQVYTVLVHSAEPSGLRCVSERTLCGT